MSDKISLLVLFCMCCVHAMYVSLYVSMDTHVGVRDNFRCPSPHLKQIPLLATAYSRLTVKTIHKPIKR